MKDEGREEEEGEAKEAMEAMNTKKKMKSMKIKVIAMGKRARTGQNTGTMDMSCAEPCRLRSRRRKTRWEYDFRETCPEHSRAAGKLWAHDKNEKSVSDNNVIYTTTLQQPYRMRTRLLQQEKEEESGERM